MYLIQNKRLQIHVFLFYYYFRFLPGWLISDHKSRDFVCSSAAACCWWPILQIPSGTTTRETNQSQPTPMNLKKCLSQNLHYPLCSPLFSFLFCPHSSLLSSFAFKRNRLRWQEQKEYVSLPWSHFMLSLPNSSSLAWLCKIIRTAPTGVTTLYVSLELAGLFWIVQQPEIKMVKEGNYFCDTKWVLCLCSFNAAINSWVKA